MDWMHTVLFLGVGVVLSVVIEVTGAEESLCVNGTLVEDVIVPYPRLKDIASQHQTRCSDKSGGRRFEGISLGYVTPWNNHGYDIAKWYGNKFTHISPVWLQILHNPEMKYKVSGTHDIDSSWMNDVKKNGVKLVPRILLDGWTPQQVHELEVQLVREKLVKLISTLVKKHNFDGVVLEGWMQLIASGHIAPALEFVKQLSMKLKESNKDFILVIPPIRGSQTIFGSKHFDELADAVTAFSIMTYDYSSGQRAPGPTSPLQWMKESVELIVPNQEDPRRAQILLGINFYGYRFTSGGPEAILGNQFVDSVKSLKGKMKLDKESAENFVEIKSKSTKQTVYYPTIFSTYKRIQLAEELGTGIAIWELGQGLDYFYELL